MRRAPAGAHECDIRTLAKITAHGPIVNWRQMKYTVALEREPDNGYVATVPILPGCVSQGDTREEALRNIREAIELYVEDCRAAGDPVPGEDSMRISSRAGYRPGP